MKVTQ